MDPSLADLAAALALSDLPPSVRDFLGSLAKQSRRRPLTPRQREAVRRILRAEPPPDFGAVNNAARARAEEVCRRLLPGGARRGRHWAAGDLAGAPGQSLRVLLEGERAGAWCDFATGARGGDLVSLAAATAGISQSEAARRLARMLGLGGDR